MYFVFAYSYVGARGQDGAREVKACRHALSVIRTRSKYVFMAQMQQNARNMVAQLNNNSRG